MTAHIYPYIHDIDAKIVETEARLEQLKRASRGGEECAQQCWDTAGLLNEYRLYKYLQENLPEEWSVFYNLHFEFWQGDHREKRQLDFLVIAPGCGVVNLECKGHYNWNGTAFYTGRDPNNTSDLIGQCKTAVRDVVTFLRQHGGDVEGLVADRGRANLQVCGTLVFPSSSFEYDDKSSIDRAAGEIVEFGTGAQVIDAVTLSERGALENYIRKVTHASYGLTLDLAQRLEVFLTQHVIAKMRDREANRLPVKVLSEQMDGLLRGREELLPLLVHSPRQQIYVTGGAGTGKTWLAKSYACQYAKAFPAHKILFVCFNKLLAASLRLDEDLKHLPNLNIVNLHQAFYERRRDAGFTPLTIAPRLPNADGYFGLMGSEQGYAMQDALDQAKLTKANRYDCIIVDEAQDFSEGHFAFLTSLLKDPGTSRFFICAGNEQNIYAGNTQVKGEWFGCPPFDASNSIRLLRNLRNSVRIHKYCRRFTGDKITEPGVAYKGQDCIIETANNRSLGKVIASLKERDGLEDRNIAVLTDVAQIDLPDTENWIRYKTQKEIFTDGTTRMVATTLDETADQLSAWRRNEGIWVSTLHAFKGLEADCVIVYLKNPNTRGDGVYVACTRAKFKLIIMPNDTRLRVDKPECLKVNLPHAAIDGRGPV